MVRRALSPNAGDYAHGVYKKTSEATEQEFLMHRKLQRSRKENSLARVAAKSLRRATTSRTAPKGATENLKTGVESRWVYQVGLVGPRQAGLAAGNQSKEKC